MERYEYRLEIAPQKRKRYSGLKKSDDAFAITMMEQINAVARDGWEFLRLETMAEKRFMRRNTSRRDYLLYRRALHTDGMTLDTPRAPRRVKPTHVSNIEHLRARMHQATGVADV